MIWTLSTEAANTCSGLIDGVLDVAKIEAGRSVVEIAPCDVSGLVREVMEMMQRARQARTTLQLLVDALRTDSTYHVRTDASMLRQVLVNLIGNAVEVHRRGNA